MPQMVDQVNSYDIYAKRAECDADGNNIKTTYATNDGPTLTAGSNITLTNANNALTIAATVPVTDVTVDGTSVVNNGTAAITMPTELVPSVSSSDDGKVLKATYSGGTGSYAWANEVYGRRTLLWSGSAGPSETALSLSEALTNFEELEFVNGKGSIFRWDTSYASTADYINPYFQYVANTSTATVENLYLTLTLDTSDYTKITYVTNKNVKIFSGSTIGYNNNATNQTSKITYIYGINRKSS